MPQTDFDDLPAVDGVELAHILGAPNGVSLKGRKQRMAARVLTDAFRGKPSPGVVIANAVTWIEAAYQWGLTDGDRMARKAWDRKIRQLFDLGASHDAD